MKNQAYLSFLGLFFLLGCVTPVHQISAPFDEQEFAPYAEKGTASIEGQAFLKTRGGDVKYGAGNTVLLIPVTAYTREVWDASLRGQVTQKDGRYERYVRTVMGDGEGKFEFRDLPPGDYFIEVPIFWEIPRGGRTGSVVKKQISVKDGERLKVMLTL